MNNCLDEVMAWMDANFLQLDGSKTEAILIGTHQANFFGNNHILINRLVIPLSSLVPNLGVTFDPFLYFEAHIKSVCQTSFFHLTNIARLISYLKMPDTEKLMHVFISSRLDYCHSLFICLPAKSLQNLQYVQNRAAQVLTKTKKIEHVTHAGFVALVAIEISNGV